MNTNISITYTGATTPSSQPQTTTFETPQTLSGGGRMHKIRQLGKTLFPSEQVDTRSQATSGISPRVSEYLTISSNSTPGTQIIPIYPSPITANHVYIPINEAASEKTQTIHHISKKVIFSVACGGLIIGPTLWGIGVDAEITSLKLIGMFMTIGAIFLICTACYDKMATSTQSMYYR